MKFTRWFATCLTLVLTFKILSFSSLASALPEIPQSCGKGNAQKDDYQLRESNLRCEGGLGYTFYRTSTGFELASFTVGKLKNEAMLSLQVPIPIGIKGQKPKISAMARNADYYLKPIELNDFGDKFKFQWSSYVLNKSHNFAPLLATASFSRGSGELYAPVIWNDNSKDPKRYTLLFSHNYNKVKNLKFKIFRTQKRFNRRNDPIYMESRSRVYRDGEQIPFIWNGRTKYGSDAPSGSYSLVVEHTVNDGSELETPTWIIQHDRKWLNL